MVGVCRELTGWRGGWRRAAPRCYSTAVSRIATSERSSRRIAAPAGRALGRALDRAFFARDVNAVAPELIGAGLFVNGVGGVIVEVEAYHHADPAAHSYRGRTERNAVMFGPPGHLYVYRSYGMHWCVNLVCEAEGSASAILLRALEPTEGLPLMRRRRGVKEARLLCGGPGRLCQAMGITDRFNAMPVDAAAITLLAPASPAPIVTGPRIGISKAVDLPWRYGLKGSRFLSKPFTPPT